MKTLSRNPALVLAAILTLTGARADADSLKTYLSLGDSLAFGYTDPQHVTPSFGDQGYVKPYADTLAARDGGNRPNVVNLALFGETTGSFFSADGASARENEAALGMPATSLNLNYPNATTTQNDLLLETIATEKNAGHTIDHVTISLGANDLFALARDPSFWTLTPAQQQAQVFQALGSIQANYTRLLTELRTELPGAQLFLLGRYNPYAAAPGSPFAALADPAVRGLNQLIAAEASAFGGHYVDTYTPFVGNEAAYTFIRDLDLTGAPNVHPNATGYSVIAAQIAAVPEPGTLSVLGAGLCVYALVRRRRSAFAR